MIMVQLGVNSVYTNLVGVTTIGLVLHDCDSDIFVSQFLNRRRNLRLLDDQQTGPRS